MNRVWHHHSLWEEVPAGLWRTGPDLFDFAAALSLMQDTARWSAAMRKVVGEWPYSCEQNLSHTEHNRVAWLGQAAVCLATGQPSIVTRKTWWQLPRTGQDAANTAATAAITYWEESLCPDRQLGWTF